jgi:photosystem II stability/assembly factor-like uncharacterized protein
MIAMRRVARAVILLATAASARCLLAQSLGWQSYGPPLFQVNDVATGIADLTVYAASANFSAGQSAISASTDGGQTWTGLEQAPSGQFYAEVLADQSDSNRLYAGATGSATTTIYFSNTAGTGWAVGQTIPALCVPSFAQSAANGTVLVACGTILSSTSDGATWTSVTNPFTEATRLAAGPGSTMYAYGPTHIFKSTDSGQTWSPSGSAPGACAGLNALRVSPSNGNALAAGVGITGAGGFQCGGVYSSADGGATWTAGGLSGVYVSDLAFDTSQSSTIYASAAFIAGVLPMGGVWRSTDAGATWDNLSLPQPGASRIALSSQNDRLYAATSLGVYQLATSVGPPTCVADAVTLCLDGARFRVRATWTSSDGTSGSGHATTLTGDTGDFWFFDSSNVELIVKVLEGCGTNAHRWVFASGLTNVLVSLSVTDIVTGTTKVYTNPQGAAFVPIQDTSAFGCP